ncbi:MAG: hypothetical protein QM747_11890 [Nocardioides sp.]
MSGMRVSGRVAAGVAAGVVCAGAAVVSAGSALADPGPYTVDFTTAGPQTWQVPAGVTSIDVTVDGAQGGPLSGAPLLGLGGKGASVVATLAVTPGETLDLNVGGAGGWPAGGIGGGGDGGTNSTNAAFSGGGGGGASSISRETGGTTLVVAGGGGGAAQLLVNGGAGDTIGGGTGTLGTGGPGGAATTTTAGAAGTAGSWAAITGCLAGADGTAGTAGDVGQGGDGAATSGLLTYGGGGGGGGYEGGGGGGAGATCVGGLVGVSSGGGGGGASYVAPVATGVTLTDGAVTGAGSVEIRYADTVAPVADPMLTPQADGHGWWRAASVAVAWNWSDQLSGVDTSACTSSSSVSDPGVTTELVTCSDEAGNVGHASVQVRIDRARPKVDLKRPKKATYHRGARVVARYSCRDALSGVASCVGSVRNGKPVNTHKLGKHTFTVTARDLAGNRTTRKVTYRVVR